MSVEPPSSGRPTGPPSGPLSGPTEPPSGPPSEPPPGSSGGAPTPEPHRPWWRSAPRVALLTTALVAVVALALVFTHSGGGGGNKGREVVLQAADKSGPDPFTGSTAKGGSTAPVTPSTATAPASSNTTQHVNGATPGLYGGSRNVSSCDVEQQIKYLQADPAKSQAFAGVEGITTSQVPAYLRSLTTLQLGRDTFVTNHGYRNGAATSYQAILQAGTAVMVDGHGVPRVRCACGNPLTPPAAQQGSFTTTGHQWSSFQPSNVAVVTPAPQIINVFVIYDPHHKAWIGRHRGDTGHHDRPVKPPARPSPSVSVTTPTPSSPCASSPGPGSGKKSPCPPSSSAPSSPSSPSSSSPSSESPSSVPPTTAPPSSDSSSLEPPAASSSLSSLSSAGTSPAL
ncbi:DUF6777 domain-containing protein [Streptomyces griseorubiginosus]|uniref:DUF6777 domain-containing protein n=1 Tax=Streptomyces griseorubiginosus TaxID=67304 RepID=UPI001AD7B445|nr:DUF6777 domain-containing protein [Streptomyces griseorubiginosus]MBO4259760.1 hypothetical protein [Streptomyces griseorubiginosus]